MYLHPVNTIKHVKDDSATVTAGATITSVIADAVDAPVLANSAEVLTGCHVKSFYCRVEVASTETDVGAIPNVYAYWFKSPGNNLTLPVPNAVGVNDNKKFVFHQEMLMLNNIAGGNPRTLFNGVIKVPSRYQRMGPDDRIGFKIFSTALDFAYCSETIYKEIR